LALVGGVAVATVALIAASTPAFAATATVGLGTSATYSELGSQTVTNTGPSQLNGDLGVSPGTAITGFPPGQIGGSRHAADATAALARADLTIAYDDAASRATTASVAGDLVGRTLIDGVYTSSGPLALSGTLTFDGQGDANSVFIVQAASTLITATASHVVTINGAQACNIFWQVGSSATLGTASTFQGTVMALSSVTVTTSAHVKGRALARNGAVTLDNNVFTAPDCGTTTEPTSAASTTTTLTTAPTTATAGKSVTLRAVVDTTTGTPTGTVTFTRNGVTVGTAAVDSSGVARLTLVAGTTLKAGSIVAAYNGSPDFAPSRSTSRALAVAPAPTPKAAVVPVAAATAATPATAAATAAAANAAAIAASASAAELANTGTGHTAAIGGIGGGCLLAGATLLLLARRPMLRGRHR
jgi:hypothetical protein